MEFVAAAGGLSFVLASLIVGMRLVLLAWRNRGLAEFVLGAGLFFMGGISYPLMTTAQLATGLGMDARIAMVVAHAVFNALGMTGVAWFTRRVFRPEAGWSLALVFATAGIYLSAFAAQVAGPGLEEFVRDPQGPYRWSQMGAVGATGWAGLESILYHLRLRKRLKLGLVDAVVTDRFRLWGIAMWLAAGITIVGRILESHGISIQGTVAGALLVGPAGLGIAACMWLAFFPPRAYLGRVRARYAAA